MAAPFQAVVAPHEQTVAKSPRGLEVVVRPEVAQKAGMTRHPLPDAYLPDNFIGVHVRSLPGALVRRFRRGIPPHSEHVPLSP